jgi:hypothetical protein
LAQEAQEVQLVLQAAFPEQTLFFQLLPQQVEVLVVAGQVDLVDLVVAVVQTQAQLVVLAPLGRAITVGRQHQGLLHTEVAEAVEQALLVGWVLLVLAALAALAQHQA